MSPATCATCIKWSPKEAGALGRFGFGVCAMQSKWVFLPPHQSCTHHSAAKADVVQARAVWLQKLGIGGGK